MSYPAYEDHLADLQGDPDMKFSFIVYRCTYESDEVWKRFMGYLDATARTELVDAGMSEALNRIDWAVQEDEALEGANVEDVRERFRAWISTDGGPDGVRYGGSRHHACIMVEKGNVDDWLGFISKTPAEQEIASEPCVYLVSARDGDEDDDECEAYTRIEVSSLIPRAYSLLEGPGWLSIYDRRCP